MEDKIEKWNAMDHSVPLKGLVELSDYEWKLFKQEFKSPEDLENEEKIEGYVLKCIIHNVSCIQTQNDKLIEIGIIKRRMQKLSEVLGWRSIITDDFIGDAVDKAPKEWGGVIYEVPRKVYGDLLHSELNRLMEDFKSPEDLKDEETIKDYVSYCIYSVIEKNLLELESVRRRMKELSEVFGWGFIIKDDILVDAMKNAKKWNVIDRSLPMEVRNTEYVRQFQQLKKDFKNKRG